MIILVRCGDRSPLPMGRHLRQALYSPALHCNLRPDPPRFSMDVLQRWRNRADVLHCLYSTLHLQLPSKWGAQSGAICGEAMCGPSPVEYRHRRSQHSHGYGTTRIALPALGKTTDDAEEEARFDGGVRDRCYVRFHVIDTAWLGLTLIVQCMGCKRYSGSVICSI